MHPVPKYLFLYAVLLFWVGLIFSASIGSWFFAGMTLLAVLMYGSAAYLFVVALNKVNLKDDVDKSDKDR